MRIALISTPFVSVPPRGYGGTELVVHELAEGLAGRGHVVTLFATGDSRTSARLRYLYDEATWPPDPMAEVNHVSWAMREVRDGRFDVVHAHSAMALACHRLAASAPLVYTLHHEPGPPTSAFYRFYPDVQFVAISHDQAAREVSLPKLAVVHHGLDPLRYRLTPRPGDYACFIGRFAPGKAPHVAIRVAGEAGVPIRVAGEVHPPDLEYFRREVQPALACPHVTYVGRVDPVAKADLLSHARALLSPLRWHEPFGLVMIEAMLSGCPVLAFPRGSARELIEPGVTGLLPATLEEMAEALRPGGPIDEIDRAQCRQRALERFSRARMVADYERLYALATGRSVVEAA